MTTLGAFFIGVGLFMLGICIAGGLIAIANAIKQIDEESNNHVLKIHKK